MFTDAQEVLDRCAVLASFSEEPSSLCRRFLTPPVYDIHRVVSEWMDGAGMSARIDAVGNIVGRRRANQTGPERVVIFGSHLDTVPNAGKYDGILGVLIGLAVVQRLKEDQLPFHLDVVGFSEEEGVRFSFPFIGSHAIAGSFQREWLDRKDADGVTLREAIQTFGLEPNRIDEAAYAPELVLGYIEPHLEQGPILETLHRPIGVVEAIVGQSRLNIAFCGMAGHAGTVPMDMRRDALVGASKFVTYVHELGKSTDGLRATVGRFSVLPNASNVIPASVALSLDVRHASDVVRLDAVAKALEYARQLSHELDLGFEILTEMHTAAVRSSNELVRLLEQAAMQHDILPTRLDSGAGHDAMVMATKFPTAMLFLRHPDGISHHPDENVRIEDVQIAIDVLVDFVRQLVVHSNAGS